MTPQESLTKVLSDSEKAIEEGLKRVLVIPGSELKRIRDDFRNREKLAKQMKEDLLVNSPDDVEMIRCREWDEIKLRGMKEAMEGLIFRLTGEFMHD
jgi:cell division protein YceG involved in septum cleavage